MRRLYVVGLALFVAVGLVVFGFVFLFCEPGESKDIVKESTTAGPESTMKEVISTMNEFVATLDSVHDPASAELAIFKIKRLGQKLADQKKRFQAQKPSKEEEKKLEQYGREFFTAHDNIKNATVRAVQKVPGKGRKLARALAAAGQLYADLDLFDVEERRDLPGTRVNLLLTISRTLVGKQYVHPVKLRRLATTYYHRRGPVGVVLEKYNWFPGPSNTYCADARLPASLIVLTAGDILGANPMSLGSLVGVCSEPPIAVLGLQIGTIASYGRPYQHLHFYERSENLKQLVLPDRGKPRHFYFLHDAMQRGCAVRLKIGDVRANFAREASGDFYQVLIVETSRGGDDNIYEELLTIEAMTLYFTKLTEKGILCLHLSNRHLNLPPTVVDVAKSLGLACRHSIDVTTGPNIESGENMGRFNSEWVMVARKEQYLQHLQAPPGYAKRNKPFWRRPAPSGRPAMTDAGLSALKQRK